MNARTQTMVQLNEQLLGLLDRRAVRAGVSRSQLIREAIEAYLAADHEATVDQRIVDGYARMPQSGEYDADEWGDVGQLVNSLTAVQQRRLSQEERDAGFDPW